MSLRQREEVQEMPRAVIAGLAAALAMHAATLPDRIGTGSRVGDIKVVPYADKAVGEELSLAPVEMADYESGAIKFKVTAFRLKDPTAALAFYQANRDPGSQKSPVEKIAAVEPGGAIFLLRGNYCLRFQGWTPGKEQLDQLFAVLPKLDQSSLPTLPAYFPPEGRVANSERYILGPATLERFAGRITPGMAAFSLGAEGALARYGDGSTLSIFNYPTPSMSRERMEEFRKLAGSVVKRSGPLVAVVLDAKSADDAERLLAKVNYQATLTWNEATPDVQVRQGANFLLAVFELAGVIIALCVAAGVAFGLIRVLRRRTQKGEEGAAMIRLDL